MARSRFSQEEVVRERVDIRVTDESRGGGGGGAAAAKSQKHLIWWCATYIFLALLALIMIIAWAMRKHAGYAWKDPRLSSGSVNYHGTFMIVAFMLLNGIADVLYRMCRRNNRLWVKIAHATIQTAGFCFIVAGLCAIFWWHDFKGLTNLVSTHSWIGLLTVLLYPLQWTVGLFGLLIPGFKAHLRQRYLPYHKFTGRAIFLLGMANILIGINKVGAGSTVMNCLALVVILYAINGGYLLGNDSFAYDAPRDLDEHGNPGGAGGGGGGGGGEVRRRSSRTSRHSGGNMVASPEEASNMYINIAGTQGTGQYQAMAEDPAIKEAMSVGRDTFSKFHDRLERKKHADVEGIVQTTTVVTPSS